MPPSFITPLLLLVLLVSACQTPAPTAEPPGPTPALPAQPYARYWWFAGDMQHDDIRYNLDWLRAHGFGGVEIAWVYPLNAMNPQLDSSYTPRAPWLGPDWQADVAFAIAYADSIGLACDLTLGTLWPFGDSHVPYERASQRFGEAERQRLVKSWEHPTVGYVVDHLNPAYYRPYFQRLLDSFPRPTTHWPQAYFVDSWEVHTKRLWTDGLDTAFQNAYGYDLAPFMDSLYVPANSAVLYDYRKLISQRVVGFYRDFDRALNAAGVASRGQCSGAPGDVLAAYACLDIPEGESMLYEPAYNSLPASAALLGGRPVVSAESFTCLYGWPRPFLREEQTADLKLVADALFANGINHLIWHGKAHNARHQDSTNFYATVHLGDAGALAADLKAFNQYLTQVSSVMRKGRTYSDVAVYLPTEDAWIKGIMPQAQQFIWAKEYYEMRYVYFPEEVAGHHPIWINGDFLRQAQWKNGVLTVGEAEFHALYVDAQYLDGAVLRRLVELAEQGLPITLKQTPRSAGTLQYPDWDAGLKRLGALPNVSSEFTPPGQPLVSTAQPLSYWARETEEALFLFFAHPKSRRLTFPLQYGQSYTTDTIRVPMTVHYQGRSYPTTLSFAPHQSLLYQLEKNSLQPIPLDFIPPTPTVKPRPQKTPWLVD